MSAGSGSDGAAANRRAPPSWGGPLTEADYAALAACWITREVADAAMLRRVDESEGREVVGQKGSRDCVGILIPYYWPGEPGAFNYRVRRDHPDWKYVEGIAKPDKKYLGPPKSGNRLYIPPGVTLEQLNDASIPIALVEGEKKALALWRLAQHETDKPRFIPIAIAGVWNWRGTIGKANDSRGERVDIKGPIPDLDRVAWHERLVYIVFDVNVQSIDSVKWARMGISRELGKRTAKVDFVNLPPDCGVNGVDDLLAAWGPARVLELFQHSVPGSRLHVVPPPQFESRPDGMFRITSQGERLSQAQLSNYRAEVITNIMLDDGVETKREFEIEAELLGESYHFSIPASEFARMDWPLERMGISAITFTNQRNYALVAIQSSSMAAEERCIYTHTGWRNIGGRWVFLHTGGAIGENGAVPGIIVRLTGPLSRYELRLPATAEELKNAVRSSLRLAQLGPPAVSFPLRAATWRAAFGDCDFSVHLSGETGAFKSELAALEQRHFGAGMDRLHLPGAWSSTANSLEALTFYTKDALIVIDDFAPQGSAADISRYYAAAERVFRAAGNRSGRGRLDSSTKLREPKPPRGLILSTGEEIPRGHSIRARILLLELTKGAISPCKLQECQGDAESGLYVAAMSAFIQWIARRYEETKAALAVRAAELRRKLIHPAHARTADMIATLQAGVEAFLEFAQDCGAVDSEERKHLADRSWEALQLAAAAQAKHQVAAEPTARFLDLLRASITSGRAHLQTTEAGRPERPESCGWHSDNQNWKSQGDCIGWVDGDSIYVESAAAYRVIQIMARDMNEPFATSPQVLKKRLHENGLLASIDAKRETLTVRRTIAGSSISVLHFSRARSCRKHRPPRETILDDRRRNVGFLVRNVGSVSGFSEEPDIGFLRRINGLHGKCREWQVFLARERCHEITENAILDLYPLNLLTTLDLHDFAS